MDNGLHLVGNMTRDPELSFGNSGTAVTKFGVAVNNRRKNASTGEWEDGDPKFFDVTCFGTLAENVAETLERGHRVTLNGKLDYQTWEKDGERRSKVLVIADSVGPDLRWATAKVERSQPSSQ